MMSLMSGILSVAALVPLLIPMIRSLRLGELIDESSSPEEGGKLSDRATRETEADPVS